MKVCTKCKIEKEEELFSFDKYHNRLFSWCKSCRNEKNKKWMEENKEQTKERKKTNYGLTKEKVRWQVIKRKYGITESDYLTLIERQKGGCAICGATDAKHWETNNLLIDHCHTKGNVRGLLCNRCNTTLGLVNDDTNILKRMIAYLK